MISSNLFKISMNRTSYSNFISFGSIYTFIILIFIIMYTISYFYKVFICSSERFSSKFISTFWTTFFSRDMCLRQLPKFTMFRTYDTNFSFSINIFYFRIIIFIAMNFSSILYKLFFRFSI